MRRVRRGTGPGQRPGLTRGSGSSLWSPLPIIPMSSTALSPSAPGVVSDDASLPGGEIPEIRHGLTTPDAASRQRPVERKGRILTERTASPPAAEVTRATVIAAPSRERDRRTVWMAIFTAGYLALSAVKIARHQMWRDELQSWSLARSSSSLGQLISRVRYEQHAPGWYVLLWVISRFTSSPDAVQGLLFVLVVVTVIYVVWVAPFPIPLRFCLLFGYFLVFEYSTIGRPYILDFLLGVVGAEFVRRRRFSGWFALTLVGLILFDDAYGSIIAVALVSAAFCTRIPRLQKQGRAQATGRGSGRRCLGTGLRPGPVQGSCQLWGSDPANGPPVASFRSPRPAGSRAALQRALSDAERRRTFLEHLRRRQAPRQRPCDHPQRSRPSQLLRGH